MHNTPTAVYYHVHYILCVYLYFQLKVMKPDLPTVKSLKKHP